MQSELAKKLKTLLDGMTQEEFDKEWRGVEKQNKDLKTNFKLLLFPVLVNFESIENETKEVVSYNAFELMREHLYNFPQKTNKTETL